MPTSIIDADSLLAIDVGSITTRAMLFDVVAGRYRYLAAGTSGTTAGAPYNDISEGVRRAIDILQSITGRVFFDDNEQIIIPTQADGKGIDAIVATLSAGKPLKVVAVGLLEDVSTESAQRLATTTYAQVVECLSLNDRRKPTARLDAILRVRPDLIIIAGGTEGGASQSVLSLIESVGLACHLSPQDQKPEVLYVGNQALVDDIEKSLQSLANLSVAPNVRPVLDVEQLTPAQTQLSKINRKIRSQSMHGVEEVDAWSNGKLSPTATAFGRVIRFLSKVYDPAKGVLGVDLGASSLTVAASFSADLHLAVNPDLGMGESIVGIWKTGRYEDIARWIPFDISERELRDYIYNKKLHPMSLPISMEHLAIEQALARQALHIGVKRLSSSFPRSAARSSINLLPWFEPVVAAGSTLTSAPTRGQSLLMLLDGLQPTGVSTYVLDQNNITPALGAAAQINSALPIQVLESSTFLNLGTVISVVGNLQAGAPAVRGRIIAGDGNEQKVDVRAGSLEIIPLALGKPATLHLQPLNRTDVGMGGFGRGGSVKVTGGVLGVVIDARGRPIRLPKEAAKRHELLKKWLWALNV
jgi:uncharacterized protein (TIGR01319 family)